MAKHYTFNAVKEMTGRELLDDLGITTTGKTVPFVVNGGDQWTAWMTMGRGRQYGTFYIHLRTITMITVIDDDGKKCGEIEGEPLRFRGRVTERIGSLRPV